MFSNLVASHGGDALQEIERDMAPRFAQHMAQLYLNGDLFHRICTAGRSTATRLDPVQRRLLDRTHLGFVRNGAALAPAQKARMAEITGRLATLHTEFGQNVLHDEKEWQLVLAAADLDGLPDFVVAGARQAAIERGLKTGWVVTLSRSLIEPFLSFCPRRDLRQIAHAAWIARGEHPGAARQPHAHSRNPGTAGRARAAAGLTRPTPISGSPTRWPAPRTPSAEAHRARSGRPPSARPRTKPDALLHIARGDGVERLETWDWLYYAEKLRQSAYAIDEAAVKPYFVLENMQRAAFDTATRLFGLTFVERPDLPVYHPDVRAYEVHDKARDPDAPIGIFLADQLRAPRQALRRVDEQLPRPGNAGRRGHADHRQQQQFRPRHADAAELRRRRNACSTNSATRCMAC